MLALHPHLSPPPPSWVGRAQHTLALNVLSGNTPPGPQPGTHTTEQA